MVGVPEVRYVGNMVTFNDYMNKTSGYVVLIGKHYNINTTTKY